MSYFTIGLVAIGFYLLATLLFFAGRVSRIIPTVIGLLGLVFHVTVLWQLVVVNWVNLGFFHALSFVSAFVVAAVFFSCLWVPARNLLVFSLPLAAMFVALEILNPATVSHQTASVALDSHILLSVLAYSFLAVAALFSIVLIVQDYLLRHKHLGRELNSFPPLSQTEKMLFSLIGLGFIMLSASLLSGFAFLEDIFAQHLAHKTLLSIIAWGLFASLLFGRYRFGWRGKNAAIITLFGFAFMMLAYFGSKFVLEMLLA